MTAHNHRTGLSRRDVLSAPLALGVGSIIGSPAVAQGKPSKLVFLGDTGPWHGTLFEEVGPAFERTHGIRVEFIQLPIDGLNARLRSELIAGTGGVDIAQWISYWGGWIAPHMEDHERLLKQASGPSSADYDWADFLPASKDLASFDGSLLGIPYRALTAVLHYQKPVLESAGISTPPENWQQFLNAATRLTRAGTPARYGYGLLGRQGPAIMGSFTPFLYSNGGSLFDPKTLNISVNDDKAVEALEFFAELLTKHMVVPPEAVTWEYDEIIANGQRDRFAMTCTLAPYGTLMNDPQLSRTGGRWSAVPFPGKDRKEDGRSWLNGWMFGVPKASKNKEWAFEFIQMSTTKAWLRRSMERGNAPTRASALGDRGMTDRFAWASAASAAMRTARPDPNHPLWPTLDTALRSAISSVLLGQRGAKAALDTVAMEWRRTFQRAGLVR